MYCINHLITRYATTKETTDPTPNNCHSIGENLSPFFISFSNVAPNIVGIARKKENSVATPLESPKSKLPIIVAPDLEVPGIIARHWNNPTVKAVLYPNFWNESICATPS